MTSPVRKCYHLPENRKVPSVVKELEMRTWCYVRRHRLGVRDYLCERELDLQKQIDALYAEIRPLEAEMAEIRRAKGALGLSIERKSAAALPNMTMKQLIIKALVEHFPDGARARDLREFFCDAWGRDIPRTHLSPQLSRLKSVNIIDVCPESRRWKIC
jgi:hypothetical protein